MRLTILFSFCWLMIANQSLADATSDAETSAKALDTQAVHLRNSGKLPAEYCPKFYASEGLSPNIRRKFEVATCLTDARKMASAFAKYKEALQLAEAARRANPNDVTANTQYDTAVRRMNEVEPELSNLLVKVTETVPGLVVMRGQEVLVEATFGIGLPLDPGTYDVTAKAPGYKSFATQVTITAPGTQIVTIPNLQLDCQPGQVVTDSHCANPVKCGANETLVADKCECTQGFSRVDNACTAATAATTAPVCAENETAVDGNCQCKPAFVRNASGLCSMLTTSSHSGGGVPPLTWVLGGVGLAGLGTGAVFGLLASSKYNDSTKAGNGCDSTTQLCYVGSAGAKMQDDSANFRTIAIVSFIAGGALLAGGIVVAFIGGGGGKESAPTTSLLVTPGGLSVFGSF